MAKDLLKEKEKVRSAKKAKKLLAMFNKTEHDSVRVLALQRMKDLAKDGDRDAVPILSELAANAPRLTDRCEAALCIPDKDMSRRAMERIMRETAGSAEFERTVSYSSDYHPSAWFALIADNGELMTLLYENGGKNIRSRVEDYAADKALMKRILLETDHLGITQADNVKAHFNGTQDDWEEIAKGAESETIRAFAAGFLDLSKRGVLEEMAENGNAAAKRRLLALDPAAYESRYVTTLSGTQLQEAVGSHRLDQAALETLCVSFRPDRSRTGTWYADCMREALEQLQEEERLEHVLEAYQKEVTDYVSDRQYEEWLTVLMERLSDRQDLLARHLSSEEIKVRYYSADLKALELLTDKGLLFNVAASRAPRAMDAAKKLEPRQMSALSKKAREQRVREYASDQWRLHQIGSGAGDEELLETIRQAVEEGRNEEPGVSAAQAISAQDAMIRALSICGRSSIGRVREKVRNALLPRITDGQGLMKFVLDEPEGVCHEAAERLKELIGGTPQEQEFIDESVRRFRDGSMNGRQMWILSKYLGTGEMETIWKYCGTDFARKLMNELEAAEEYDISMRIANNIRLLYRNVPESRDMLAGLDKRRFVKHSDFDAACASESMHENTSFVLEFD